MVAHPDPWPNSLDLSVTIAFFLVIVLLPAAGLVFMAIDLRTYWRSLRRGLAVITRGFSGVPEWAQRETPRAIAALGLRMPCTEEDLKRAYRKRVKKLHPDHGGDERRFLLLQAHFEEALAIVGAESPGGARPYSASQTAA